MNYRSSSPDQTRKIAADWAKKLEPGDQIGLFGDLGAGKTVFVQGLARGIGITDRHYVNSPTFTLVNIYEGSKISIVHADLYRVEKLEEISQLGLEEQVTGLRILVIEWAEKYDGPLNHRVTIRTTKGGRDIEII